MRSRLEIQKAHDTLVAILLGEVPDPGDGTGRENLAAAAGVLCWVLRHDHNPTFGDFLAAIDEYLTECGYAARMVQ